MAVLGENRLRVELHAFNIQLTMSQTHDRFSITPLILGPGRDLETVGQCLGVHDQTVVTRCRQRA